jgi:hypothetical protein
MALNKFTDYRCIIPGTTVVSEPWFPMTDVCPCDPGLSDPTGRGFTPCPFGISEPGPDLGVTVPLQSIARTNNGWVTKDVKSVPYGTFYPKNNYLPPQLEPRPLMRIGVSWRS